MAETTRQRNSKPKTMPKKTAGRKPKRLNVYRSWCKKCGICVALCPKKALEADEEGYPRWTESGSCVACRMCELRCPDFAIEVITDDGEKDAAGH
jgi:2-oxoglutarate ferredoxin oxidoreductase subunit delta